MLILLQQANPYGEFTAAITPYLPLLGIVAGGLLIGIFQVYNRRRGNIETKAPDVNQIWQQQQEQAMELDLERRMRRKLEDWAYDFRKVFIGYVHRVQRGGTTQLTERELKFKDTDPTTVEMKVVKNKEANDG